jgi:hypothetical protein
MFLTLAQISKNRCQITPLSTIHLIEDAQESDLEPIFGDLSQREKVFEIKSHLVHILENLKII